MSVALNAGIREAVEGLVRANIEAEPAVVKAYLFPSDREISLVYVDPTTSPLRADEQVAPFYFGANRSDPSSHAAYTIAVALNLAGRGARVGEAHGAVLILRPQGRVFTPLRSYEGQWLRDRRPRLPDLPFTARRSRPGAHGLALTAWCSE